MKKLLTILLGCLFGAVAINYSIGQETPIVKVQPNDPLPAPIKEFLYSDPDLPFGKRNERAPKELDQFGQLAGVWKLTSNALYQGKWYSGWPAYWAWKYGVDGSIILDYFYQSKEDFAPIFPKNFDSHGLNLRIYDAETERWKITWIANTGPESRISASYIDGEIHMRPMGVDSASWRIVFSKITNESFEWKRELPTDSGTWAHQFYYTAERIN